MKLRDEKRIAVLIDADNVAEKYLTLINNEVSRYGTPTIKRIYGDWTKPQLSKWKGALLSNSIIPIQQYNYTTGKNSSDSALIIDAMDILYSNNVEGFCIVSSDSDFTRLAARLREAGMFVLGMGEKKTAAPFIAACEKFTYLEVIKPEVASSQVEKPKSPPAAAQINSTAELSKAIEEIVRDVSDDDGWVFLGELGNILSKRHPSFDTRNYGYRKLTPLLESLKGFEIRSDQTSDPNVKHKFIRIKGGSGAY